MLSGYLFLRSWLVAEISKKICRYAEIFEAGNCLLEREILLRESKSVFPEKNVLQYDTVFNCDDAVTSLCISGLMGDHDDGETFIV